MVSHTANETIGSFSIPIDLSRDHVPSRFINSSGNSPLSKQIHNFKARSRVVWIDNAPAGYLETLCNRGLIRVIPLGCFVCVVFIIVLIPTSRSLFRLVLDQGNDHAVQVEEEHDQMEAQLDE